MSLSEYEQRRLKNLAENRRILGELGALNSPPKRWTKPSISKLPTAAASKKRQSLISNNKNRRQSNKPKPVSRSSDAAGEPEAVQDADSDAVLARRLAAEFNEAPRRSSRRLEGRPAPQYIGQCDGYGKDDSGEENWVPSSGRRGRGSDDDDDEYDSEDEDSDGEAAAVAEPAEQPLPAVAAYSTDPSGLHRPTVAGIHGGTDGAYSIALSGGYEDDIDLGSHFTYTGEGGRDLKGTKSNPKNLRTAPQTKDQALSRNNAALVRSAENGQPVRVIRGYKLRSEFAPPEGYYRYDGLYRVEKWWYTTGMAGFGVYKFAFKRLPDQAPAPWEEAAAEPVVYNFRTDYRPEEEEPSAAVATDADENTAVPPTDNNATTNSSCVQEEESSKKTDEKRRGRKKKSTSKTNDAGLAVPGGAPVELDYEAVLSGQIDVGGGTADCEADGKKKSGQNDPNNDLEPPATVAADGIAEKKRRGGRKSKAAATAAVPTEPLPSQDSTSNEKKLDVENVDPITISAAAADQPNKRRGRKSKSVVEAA
uniref:YDG domain-containing protein n=1 Tax=Macrostomum lignano TaxID=282301 RepID=A0A1I8GDG6_9PLAT